MNNNHSTFGRSSLYDNDLHMSRSGFHKTVYVRTDTYHSRRLASVVFSQISTHCSYGFESCMARYMKHCRDSNRHCDTPG